MGHGETNVGYADRNSAREAAIQSVQTPAVKRPQMILVGPPDVRLKGKAEENAVHDWHLPRALISSWETAEETVSCPNLHSR